MPRFALTINDQFVRLENRPSKPADIPHKSVKWLPCDPVAAPAFDPKVKKLLGPTYSVGTLAVTEEWQAVDLSAPELAAAKTAAIRSINGPFRPLLKILLNHENRIRAKATPPEPALTLAEFEALVETWV